MTFPTLAVKEAFVTAPLADTPTFATHAKVRAFTAKMCGKGSELDRPSAGTFNCAVDVRNRDVDPANTAGPYYPNVLPNRRVKLEAVVSGDTYYVWEGFADAHNVSYNPASPKDAVLDLPCTDGFKILNRARLTGMAARPEETSGYRLQAILDHVGWPSTRRSIAAGGAVLMAEDLSDRTALDAVLQIDDTENGRTFIHGDGTFILLDRNDMQTAPSQTTSQATFSDTGAANVIPYSGIVLENSETLLRNSVEITHPTHEKIVVTDATSVTAHGPITYSREVRDATRVAMNSTAERLLALYKDPITRVLGLTVHTSRATASYPGGLYPAVLDLRHGDRVTVVRTPPGGGSAITQECYVDLVTHTADASKQSWVTQFGLSYAGPAQTYATWGAGFIWGTSKWGY